MNPKEFAEMRRTDHAPCGCKVHVDGNQHSCKHGPHCTDKAEIDKRAAAGKDKK